MARRKASEENIRTLTKAGGSLGITLPIGIVGKLRWRQKQKVVVRLQGQRIIIEDWKKQGSRPYFR